MSLFIKDLIQYYEFEIKQLSLKTQTEVSLGFLSLNYGPFDQIFYKFRVLGKHQLSKSDYILIHLEDIDLEGIVYQLNNDEQTIIISSKKEYSLSNQVNYSAKKINDYYSYNKIIDELNFLNKQSISEKINNYKFINSSIHNLTSIDSIELNNFQKYAINNSFNDDLLSIIHGPPGTGKTYTLSYLINHYKKHQQKVLACAPTNVATDNLALACIKKGLNVTRIGVSEKISVEVSASFIDYKIKNHKDYKVIEAGLKQMLKLTDTAFKFVRTLTPEKREERLNARKDLKNLRKELRCFEKQIFNEIIEQSDVICSTPISSFSKILRDIKFDVVVLDEASQATVGMSVILWNKAPKIILAGDHKQLPPFINSKSKSSLFDISFMDFAIKKGKVSELLSNQYRMEGNIMNFSNQKFYNSTLINSTKDTVSNNIKFIDTAGTGFNEDKDLYSGSYFNVGEGVLIKKIIESENINKNDLLIITPYSAQMEYLKKEILDVKINTIDSAQGSEAKVVILSLVRSNENGEIGFLKDYRRVNVALTRAKQKMFVIGDSSSIASDKFYQDYLRFIEQQEAYKSAFEYDIF